MSNLINSERSSHWYLRLQSGKLEPCYEVERADGSGMRKTTLADARKMGLLPSVTSILSVIHRPQLEAWKQEQCIKAALTLPRLSNESEDDFAKRVVEDAFAQSDKAKELGTEVHNDIEAYLIYRDRALFNKTVEMLGLESAKHSQSALDWIDNEIEHVHGVEMIVGGFGAAGKLDLHCTLKGIGRAVVDFKTSAVKRDKDGIKQPAFWGEWHLQLTSYKAMLGDKDAALVSVVIDTAEPGPVFVHQWPKEDEAKALKVFLCAFEIWKWAKNFQP